MQAWIDCDLGCRRIGNDHRHPQRVDSSWPPFDELGVLFVHRLESADACAKHHGYSTWINYRDGFRGHGPCFSSCHKPKLGAAIGSPHEQGPKGSSGSIRHAACNAHSQIVAPICPQSTDSGETRLYAIPSLGSVMAKR